MNINVRISGVEETIERIRRLNPRQKAQELTQRLADYGLQLVSMNLTNGLYDGENDSRAFVEQTENGYKIVASGQAILFYEFGAGVTYGYGHPLADELGMGPGTYPNGKGHWDDPNGWIIPGTNIRTHGNPPNMPVYYASIQLKDEIERIAREVFND